MVTLSTHPLDREQAPRLVMVRVSVLKRLRGCEVVVELGCSIPCRLRANTYDIVGTPRLNQMHMFGCRYSQ